MQFNKRELDPHEYVAVTNGYPGTLIYRSRKTGDETKWEEYLNTQELELQELKSAKISDKKFFNAHWFILEPDVVEWLGATKIYENWRSDEEILKMCDKTPDKILEYIDSLTDEQLETFVPRIYHLVESGEIDSRAVIKALKERLNIELVDD